MSNTNLQKSFDYFLMHRPIPELTIWLIYFASKSLSVCQVKKKYAEKNTLRNLERNQGGEGFSVFFAYFFSKTLDCHVLPIDQTHLDYSPFLSALAYFATMENESNCDDEEHLLLLLLLQDMLEELDEMEESVEGFLQKEIKKQRREERCLPSPKNRTSWEEFMDKISTGHFWRMFRMSQDAFDLLCKDVCKKIGN